MASGSSKRLALVMGVANRRSIAWACVQSLLERNFDCILTYQSDRFTKPVQKLIDQHHEASADNNIATGRVLGSVACNVEEGLSHLFADAVPEILQSNNRKFDSMVHSLAYCDMTDPRLSRATWPVYGQAMQISAYSFLEMTRCAVDSNLLHPPNSTESSSIVALSYLGAVRTAPNYQCMGPAKAALEATVRGLAAEYHHLHINSVSAGPIATAAAKGGIRNFSQLQQHVADTAPLRRSVTTKEVAAAVTFLSEQTGITGQTLYVDGGYSSVIPVVPQDQ
jgi:enoyl-[acyl-carrier protein] reductase I